MRRILEVSVFIVLVTSWVQAEMVGPLVKDDADFPGFAVFQINGCAIKPGDKVTVQRQGVDMVGGKVTETAGDRCLVKLEDDIPLNRGDLLHKTGSSKSSAPTFGAAVQHKPIQRTRLSKQLAAPKLKSGRSPHVITPAEFAAQSRRSSLYSLGSVHDVKSMAEQSRHRSRTTTGGVMSVAEFAKQMGR